MKENERLHVTVKACRTMATWELPFNPLKQPWREIKTETPMVKCRTEATSESPTKDES